MARINDLVTFPNTTPALDDHVLGTDVSDTSNSADGESVTFKFEDIRDLLGGFIPVEKNISLSGLSEVEIGLDFSLYREFHIHFDNVTYTTGGSNLGTNLDFSDDGGSSFGVAFAETGVGNESPLGILPSDNPIDVLKVYSGGWNFELNNKYYDSSSGVTGGFLIYGLESPANRLRLRAVQFSGSNTYSGGTYSVYGLLS